MTFFKFLRHRRPRQHLLLKGLILALISNLTLSKITPQKYEEESQGEALYPQEIFNKKIDGADMTQTTRFIQRTDTRHPLDPLTAFEMRLVGVIVRLYNSSSTWQFKYIGLREPDKRDVYPYFLSGTTPPSGVIPRRANVLVADPIFRRPIWAVVNLSTYKVESWAEDDTAKIAGVTVEDAELGPEVAFKDPAVIQRFTALGVNDMRHVVPDVWDAGYVADNPNYAQANKLLQIYFYEIRENGTNYYAHPFNFVVYVDLGARKVRGIENLPIHKNFDTVNQTGNNIPSAEANYFPRFLSPETLQRDLRPLRISQPTGSSFGIEGRQVSWNNFTLRIGYNAREGLHLYTISYNDHGEIRPVVYRMSLSEVYLQYNDPRPPYHRKAAFDEANGEFGSSSRSLPVHQFCRGNAFYFDADHHNERAETWVTSNSVCVVEEDDGILWAHYDHVSSQVAATRSQRLSISSLVAIGNTDYWISFRLYTDATIELAIKMTGILSTNLMAVDVKAPPYGNLVAPQVYSQIYQHFFAVRIDADVDGRSNSVSLEDIVPVSTSINPQNPAGNGLMVNSTILKTPAEAATDNKPARSWRISNLNRKHPLNGTPVGWKLIPQTSNPQQPNMLTSDSPLRARIPWAEHNMWVTSYNPDQIFAGGKYLTDGVAVWTDQSSKENIEDVDVVLWHVFNYVHLPEVEDWPVLSSCPGSTGFRLRPSGFFTANPAIATPPASETTASDGITTETTGGDCISVTNPSDIYASA